MYSFQKWMSPCYMFDITCMYVLYSMSFSVPLCKRPMCGSDFLTSSPSSSRIKRNTPWAAGCCGPKLRITFWPRWDVVCFSALLTRLNKIFNRKVNGQDTFLSSSYSFLEFVSIWSSLRWQVGHSPGFVCTRQVHHSKLSTPSSAAGRKRIFD